MSLLWTSELAVQRFGGLQGFDCGQDLGREAFSPYPGVAATCPASKVLAHVLSPTA